MHVQDTISAAFAKAVAQRPNHVFLDLEGERYTYKEVDVLTTEIAHGLLQAGIETGERVASLLDNSLEAIVVWLAATKIGAISAPVNTAYKRTYLQSQMSDSDSSLIVVGQDHVERIREIVSEVPALRTVYVVGSDARFNVGHVTISPFDDLHVGKFSSIPDNATPDQTAMLMYTSGTTGASKGCMTLHNMACNLAHRFIRANGYNRDDILWTCLPLFHFNAISSVVAAMVAQCTVAVVGRFSVTNFWPEIERTGATIVNLLGSMTALIAAAPPNDAAERCRNQLRIVMAAPFTADVAETWRERFGVDIPAALGYGMTEAPTITGIEPGDGTPPPGSSGHGGIDFEVQIFDDDDSPVKCGEVGEIVCRPLHPNVIFGGYWRRPEATVRALRNLWFHTGDIGRLDEKGWLFFVDRKMDYIRRRGENISSMEMEEVLHAHPAIRDVAVHAVTSPLGDEEVKVTAELVNGQPLTEEELCKWTIDRLPYFAVPLYIEFREALPRSPTGKVLKEQLRREGKTRSTWDREKANITFERW